MAQEEVEKGSWATGSVGRDSVGLGRDSHASGTCIVLTLITFVHISSSPMDCFETGTKKSSVYAILPHALCNRVSYPTEEQAEVSLNLVFISSVLREL